MIPRVLTVLAQGAVGDKSLYEHIPQRLIDGLTHESFFALTRVAGVDAHICDLRDNGNVGSA